MAMVIRILLLVRLLVMQISERHIVLINRVGLNNKPDVQMIGDTANCGFGFTSPGCGDVNGDGSSDVIGSTSL